MQQSRTPEGNRNWLTITLNDLCSNSTESYFDSSCCVVRKIEGSRHYVRQKSSRQREIRSDPSGIIIVELRAVLSKSQAKWEMKIFDPASNFACS